MPIASLFRKTPPPARPRRKPAPSSVTLANGQSLPVAVRRNARAKRLILRLSPDAAGVVVTAPPRVDASTIAQFLERHSPWIEERLARRPPTLSIADGAVLPFRGRELHLVHRTDLRGNRLAEEGGALRLCVGGSVEHFGRRAVDVLKREARRDLEAAVRRHAGALGLEPKSITIRDTRSRWGSCSSDRRLSFSWRIVMAPPGVLDYLAAHEVAHFREMNHSPAFWALCRTLCPQTDVGRDWLKRHGASLHAVVAAA